jgi:hypothetical protein
MNIGMLWYDDDTKRRLDEKVARAVEFYRAKYGVQPTECYVHPGMLAADQPSTAAGVRLRPNRTIIKNHFWLGVDESLAAARTEPAKAKPAARQPAPRPTAVKGRARA